MYKVADLVADEVDSYIAMCDLEVTWGLFLLLSDEHSLCFSVYLS